MKLKNKIALISGASRGIGEAIALGFAKQGADIFVHYNSKPELAEKVSVKIKNMGCQAWLVKANLAHPEEIKNMFQVIREKTNHLDILVNNAGFEFGKPFWEFTSDEWDSILNVNLRGAFLCMKYATQLMLNQKYGKIINMSSIHDMVSRKGFLPYCVSKAGLLMLTKAAALELAEQHIHVNAVSPGAIYTDMNRKILDEIEPQYSKEHIPWQRIGESEEVVSATVYLASDESSYVTGTTIYIDGGYRLNAVRK